MLNLDNETFATGRSAFQDKPPGTQISDTTAKVYVKFRLDLVEAVFLAQLDTGAAWSCLDPELAEAANALEGQIEQSTIRTWFGDFKGSLTRVQLTLVADEGESLEVEGTVFVPTDPGWIKGLNVVGYGGCLERIRLALDPQSNHFYFGAS